MYMYMIKVYTVEPPIKDTLRLEHNRNNLSTKDTLHGPSWPKMFIFVLLLIHFEPLKSGQPLFTKDKMAGPSVSIVQEVPLYKT